MGKKGEKRRKEEISILGQVKRFLKMERKIEKDNRGEGGRNLDRPRRKVGGLMGIAAAGLVALVSLFPGCRGISHYNNAKVLQEITKGYETRKPKVGDVAGEGCNKETYLVWIKKNNKFERIELPSQWSFVKREKDKIILRDDNTNRLLRPIPLNMYDTVEERIKAGEPLLKGVPEEQKYHDETGKSREAEKWIQHILDH